jgi:uncharacterized protein YukE
MVPATAKLRSKLDELLSERARLTGKLARLQSMVDNKARQQDSWDKGEGVYKEYQSKIFRWNNDMRETEAKLSELDTETEEYERTIGAVQGHQVLRTSDPSVPEQIKQIRQGWRLELEGREMAERAEEEVMRIYGEWRAERARRRGVGWAVAV